MSNRKCRLVTIGAGCTTLYALIAIGILAIHRDTRDPVGLWVVSEPQADEVNSRQRNNQLFIPPNAFAFDGISVYVFFTPMRDGDSEGYERLQAKFEGDDLLYRHPNNTWEYIATLDNITGVFRDKRSEIEWVFYKHPLPESMLAIRPYDYDQ